MFDFLETLLLLFCIPSCFGFLTVDTRVSKNSQNATEQDYKKFLIINNNGIEMKPTLLFDAKSSSFAKLYNFTNDAFKAHLSCSVIYKGNNYIIGGYENPRAIAKGWVHVFHKLYVESIIYNFLIISIDLP